MSILRIQFDSKLIELMTVVNQLKACRFPNVSQFQGYSGYFASGTGLA